MVLDCKGCMPPVLLTAGASSNLSMDVYVLGVLL